MVETNNRHSLRSQTCPRATFKACRHPFEPASAWERGSGPRKVRREGWWKTGVTPAAVPRHDSSGAASTEHRPARAENRGLLYCNRSVPGSGVRRAAASTAQPGASASSEFLAPAHVEAGDRGGVRGRGRTGSQQVTGVWSAYGRLDLL